MSELTQEQMQIAVMAAQAERESYKFLKRHVGDFTPCEANSNVLTQFMVANKLDWNQENLETAYESTKNNLVQTDPAYRPQLDMPDQPTTPAADELPPAPANAKWPTTKAEIQAMSQTDYRREFHNVKTGAAFRARINAVLQRGV